MKRFSPKPWLLPQPVLVIGTFDKDGLPNAMNAAWAGTWERNEIMISMGNHATTDNLRHNGDFTVAFATKPTMVAADYVGIVSGRSVHDKVEHTGWHCERSEKVNAPVFTDFPLTLECHIKRKIDENVDGVNLVAEVIGVLCDERYLGDDGQPDVEKMELISFDPIHHKYILLGKSVGQAFRIGNELKEK